MQVQYQGPEPVNVDALPAEQRPAVGAMVKVWPFALPHRPLINGSNPRLAARFSLGLTIALRGSVMRTPFAVIRDVVWSSESVGKAARSMAAAPATWGDACDVPPMVMLAAVIRAPGASMVRNEALFEKQVT